jgi:hypothetical protein
MGKVGIATIGGVEAAVKVMQTFPKCQTLLERACGTLCNLAGCTIGKAKAIESGGIKVLLAAVNNHLGFASPCQHSYRALYNIVDGLGFASPSHQGSHHTFGAFGAPYNFVDGSKKNTGRKENTGLLIRLGGAKAVAKVRTKWPDNNDVQARVRLLANSIITEMKTWVDEE